MNIKVGGVVLTIFLAYGIVTRASPGPETRDGSVCVAAIGEPERGEVRRVGAGHADRLNIKSYSVKVDDQSPVRVLGDKGVRTLPLSPKDKHIVRIFGDDKQIESFSFRFDVDEELCLLLQPIYLNWMLWNCKDAKAWRLCNETQPPPELWPSTTCTILGMRVIPSGGTFKSQYRLVYVVREHKHLMYVDTGNEDSDKNALDRKMGHVPDVCPYQIRYDPHNPSRAEALNR